MAFLFSFAEGRVLPASYNDGYQAGAGLKCWFSEAWSVRALLAVKVVHAGLADTTTSTFGLSAAGEYHLRIGAASPYVGVLIACQVLSEETGSFMDYAFGPLGGLELTVLKNLSFFAEYQALFVRDINGFTFALGQKPVFGFAIYF
jgi:opacity protein-like surface antigen